MRASTFGVNCPFKRVSDSKFMLDGSVQPSTVHLLRILLQDSRNDLLHNNCKCKKTQCGLGCRYNKAKKCCEFRKHRGNNQSQENLGTVKYFN